MLDRLYEHTWNMLLHIISNLECNINDRGAVVYQDYLIRKMLQFRNWKDGMLYDSVLWKINPFFIEEKIDWHLINSFILSAFRNTWMWSHWEHGVTSFSREIHPWIFHYYWLWSVRVMQRCNRSLVYKEIQ